MPGLGLDFGNTISCHPDGEPRQYMPDAIRVISKLVECIFKQNTYIVSRVDPGGDKNVLDFLDNNHFWEITNINRDHTIFCSKRSDKALICEKLDITDFVDDRLECLYHMQSVPNRYSINPSEQQRRDFMFSSAIIVNGWPDIERLIFHHYDGR